MSEPFCPLDKDLKEKLSSVGADLEADLRQWIEGLTGDKFPDRNFGKSLKNGILLCRLANKISPGICPKIQSSPAPFVQMENINAYLNAAKKLGVPAADLFMTVDLFEEKNIGQVIRNLDTLRRITVGGKPVAPNTSVARSSPSPTPPPSYSSSSSSSYSSPRKVSSSPAPALPPRDGPALPARDGPTTSTYSGGGASLVKPVVPMGVGLEKADLGEPVCALDKDLKEKLSTVGSDLEADIRAWVERLTGEKFPDRSFGKSLKNGIILCRLANAIRPGICPKIQSSPAAFVQMENIAAYLAAARKFGVAERDLFVTVDLFEEKNIGQVIRNLDAVRRATGK